jgi:O-antigen/teichoic acid export membrane protein
MKSNYYISSVFWSSISRIINSIVGFVSVPLLLHCYGIENYGILNIAAAANGYMQLMDLGINTGSIRFFSQWKAEKKYNLINRIAGTSITFYTIVGFINAALLLLIAIFGRSLFSVSETQFIQLRMIFFIMALFSITNWVSTVFNQLLISNEKIAYTQKVTSILNLLKLFLVWIAIKGELSLTLYYLILSLIYTGYLLCYAYTCKKEKYIYSFKFQFHWNEFKQIFTYSLSIFVLSIFQMTASQSRPLILSIVASNGAETTAEYKIIEVFPVFIISLAGMLSGILLPKACSMTATNDTKGKEKMAYDGTLYASIFVTLLSFPVIINSSDLIRLYVGEEFLYLNKWILLMIGSVLIYLHTSPCSSLYLASGKVKEYVYSTIINCFISIFLNIILCKRWGVGSSVIGYTYYVIAQTIFQYIFMYSHILNLNSIRIFKSYILPVGIGIVTSILFFILNKFVNWDLTCYSKYIQLLFIILKSIVWLIIYITLLHVSNIVNMKQLYIKFFQRN